MDGSAVQRGAVTAGNRRFLNNKNHILQWQFSTVGPEEECQNY